MDCLIVECSFAKKDPRSLPHHVQVGDGAPMAPAWNVYQGNQVRIVRRWFPFVSTDVLIFSGKFGLLDPRSVIPLYNQKLTWHMARDREWRETHIVEAWEWLTECDVGKYTHVYHSLNRAYEHALCAGLREFGVSPSPLVAGYTSRGLRLQALRSFCQERHDPHGIVSCVGGVPTVVGRQLRLWAN